MQVSGPLHRLLAAFGLITVCVSANAQDSAWRFSVTPYLWLPNINGTLRYTLPPSTGSDSDVETGPNDYLENLSALLMLSGEARSGAWALFGDLIYLKFESEDSSVKSVDFSLSSSNPLSTTLDIGTTSELEGLTWTLGASRTVLDGANGTLDVLAGLRYFELDVHSDWRLSAAVSGPGGAVFPASGRIGRETTLWDGILGVRGRAQFGTSKWSAPYYLDIGVGSSEFTWHALAGIAYGFSWGEVTLAYRHLFYDQADNELLQDFEFSGPTFGATFRF